MEKDLHSLKIDKSLKVATRESSSQTARWIAGSIVLFLLLGAARYLFVARADNEPEVQTIRVAAVTASGGASDGNVILNATGYIVAHHKIQVASKVVGKVAWIGVEKGDRVKENQVIVRLEDAEYLAQLRQAKANLESAQADLANAKISLARVQRLVDEKVSAQQQLDDARGRYDNQTARVASLERTYELVRLGPRKEAVMQAQLQLTHGRVLSYYWRRNRQRALLLHQRRAATRLKARSTSGMMFQVSVSVLRKRSWNDSKSSKHPSIHLPRNENETRFG